MKTILLIEQDPFVRTDVVQALQSQWPDHDVRDHAKWDEVGQMAPPDLLLADISRDEISAKLAGLGWGDHDVTCVLTGAREGDTGHRFLRLPRPFTDLMLIRIVDSALHREIVDH